MSREKRPAFQFYPKDFLTDERVRLMTHTERGIYITLLCMCWLETSLPSDVAQLATLVAMPVKRFVKMWKGPLSKCFRIERGRLYHKRLDAERDKQTAYRLRQSAAGKASAAARNHGSTNVQPDPQPEANRPVEPEGNSSISDLRSSFPSSSSSPVLKVLANS